MTQMGYLATHPPLATCSARHPTEASKPPSLHVSLPFVSCLLSPSDLVHWSPDTLILLVCFWFCFDTGCPYVVLAGLELLAHIILYASMPGLLFFLE